MVLNFPVLKLPMSLVQSLKLQTSSGNERVKTFKEDEIQGLIVSHTMEEKCGDLRRYTQDYGWDTVLDELVKFYFRTLKQQFPSEKSEDLLVKELKQFCLEFETLFDLENYRCYLLAFYLQYYSIRTGIRGIEQSQGVLSTFFQLAQVCRKKKIKSTQADYLILTLWHFYHFWGDEKFQKNFSTLRDYHQLYRKLSSEQQERLIHNTANYALSIYDEMILTEELVL